MHGWFLWHTMTRLKFSVLFGFVLERGHLCENNQIYIKNQISLIRYLSIKLSLITFYSLHIWQQHYQIKIWFEIFFMALNYYHNYLGMYWIQTLLVLNACRTRCKRIDISVKHWWSFNKVLLIVFLVYPSNYYMTTLHQQLSLGWLQEVFFA